MLVAIKLPFKFSSRVTRAFNLLRNFVVTVLFVLLQMNDMLQGDAELKAEIGYNLRRLEIEEEERKHAESQEIAESQEQRMEDENRNIQALVTSPEEICEQLQNLIVQLTRCDASPTDIAVSTNTSMQPVVRLTRSDESMTALNRKFMRSST